MSKSNSVIVLSALLHGIPCRIGQFTYRLDIDFRLCVEGKNETNVDDDPLLIVAGDLSSFICLCNNATEYEMDVIALNLALNS